MRMLPQQDSAHISSSNAGASSPQPSSSGTTGSQDTSLQAPLIAIISNLSASTTESQLKDLFPGNQVKSVTITRSTAEPPDVSAHIELTDLRSFENVISQTGMEVDGHKVHIRHAASERRDSPTTMPTNRPQLHILPRPNSTDAPSPAPSPGPSSPFAPSEDVGESADSKEKKKRSRVTPEQLMQLERFFAVDRSPTAARRKEIATLLGMQERQTQIWFQNRRAKAKQMDSRRQAAALVDPSPENAPPLSPGFDLHLHSLIHESHPVTIIPCTELSIGSWKRVASPMNRYELITYICEAQRRLTWFIHPGTHAVKMDIPFDTIVDTKFTNLAPGAGTATFILSEPPVFYLEHIAHAVDGTPLPTWRRCADWTEDHQATNVLKHDLAGSAVQMLHILRNLSAALTGSEVSLTLPSYHQELQSSAVNIHTHSIIDYPTHASSSPIQLHAPPQYTMYNDARLAHAGQQPRYLQSLPSNFPGSAGYPQVPTTSSVYLYPSPTVQQSPTTSSLYSEQSGSGGESPQSYQSPRDSSPEDYRRFPVNNPQSLARRSLSRLSAQFQMQNLYESDPYGGTQFRDHGGGNHL